VADREPHELGTRRQTELSLEPEPVGFDGPRRDRQHLRGLRARVTQHQKVEDLALAGRQGGEHVFHGRPSVLRGRRRGIRKTPDAVT
jgi:hypothetical protein